MNDNDGWPELELSSQDMDSLAVAALESVLEVYEDSRSPELVADLEAAWRRYVETFLSAIATRRPPTPAEIEEFKTVSERRRAQGVTISDIQRAFRAGSRVLLNLLLDRVPRESAGDVASFTLRFEDVMATAMEDAYIEASQRLIRTTEEPLSNAVRDYLDGRSTKTLEELLQSLPDDHTLAGTYVVLHLGSELVDEHEARTRIHNYIDALSSVIPTSLRVEMTPCSVFTLLPGDPHVTLPTQLQKASYRTDGGEHVQVSVSLPKYGPDALRSGAEEALRAAWVGRTLDPDAHTHNYLELGPVDVFGELQAVLALVDRVIGPLLEIDRSKGSDLTESLRAYLESGQNRKIAAGTLNVHVNTLDYRLRKVEEALPAEILENTLLLLLALRLQLAVSQPFIDVLDR